MSDAIRSALEMALSELRRLAKRGYSDDCVIEEVEAALAAQQPAQGVPFATVDGAFLDRVLSAAKPAQGEAVAGSTWLGRAAVAAMGGMTVGEFSGIRRAPPAPSVSVPDGMTYSMGVRDYVDGWNACRAAMLASGGKAGVPEPSASHVQIARRILLNLGFSMSPSCEPGADDRVDRVAALLAAAPEPPR